MKFEAMLTNMQVRTRIAEPNPIRNSLNWILSELWIYLLFIHLFINQAF